MISPLRGNNFKSRINNSQISRSNNSRLNNSFGSRICSESRQNNSITIDEKMTNMQDNMM